MYSMCERGCIQTLHSFGVFIKMLITSSNSIFFWSVHKDTHYECVCVHKDTYNEFKLYILLHCSQRFTQSVNC